MIRSISGVNIRKQVWRFSSTEEPCVKYEKRVTRWGESEQSDNENEPNYTVSNLQGKLLNTGLNVALSVFLTVLRVGVTRRKEIFVG